MEEQQNKITIKSNYHGDLRRFVLEGEEMNSVYLQLMLSDLYKIPIESVYVTILLDSQRVEVTSQLLLKCARKGIAVLRIDVEDVSEPAREESPALMMKLDVDSIRAACRTQVVELLNSNAFIDSIVDRVVPIVLNNLDQSSGPKLSKSVLESTINDSVFQSVVNDDEESYIATSDDSEDDMPSLHHPNPEEIDPISSSEDEVQWDESTATETDSSFDSDAEDEIEDPMPADEEQPAIINEPAQEEDQEQVKDEDSDPEDFQSFEVVKADEHQPEEPKRESRPILKSLFAFIKERTVDRIRPQNEGLKEEDIPNLEELLTRLEEMGFQDREVNIAALRFHRTFKEGLDEVIEDLLSQRSSVQKPEPKDEPIDAPNPDAPIADEAPLNEEGREDVRDENEDQPIESPQMKEETDDLKPELRGRLNSTDVQRLIEAGMTKDMAVRTLLSQLY